MGSGNCRWAVDISRLKYEMEEEEEEDMKTDEEVTFVSFSITKGST